jgi:hypothetical protein
MAAMGADAPVRPTGVAQAGHPQSRAAAEEMKRAALAAIRASGPIEGMARAAAAPVDPELDAAEAVARAAAARRAAAAQAIADLESRA